VQNKVEQNHRQHQWHTYITEVGKKRPPEHFSS